MSSLFSLIFLIGINQFSISINKKLKIQDTIFNHILTYTFIITCILGILNFLFLFKINGYYFVLITFIFFCLIGLNEIIKLTNYQKVRFFFSKINLILFFLIFLFYISSYLPVSDMDSLRYHLFIPKKIIEGNFFESYTPDFVFFSFNEILNLYGLLLGFENSSSLINFLYFLFGVLLIKFYRKKILNDFSNNNIPILIFASSLYLISAISSQKLVMMQSILIPVIFIDLFLNWGKKHNDIESCVKIYLLFFISAIKFIYILFPILYFILILIEKKNFYFIKISIIFILAFLINHLPFLLIKYQLFANPIIPIINLKNEIWVDDFKTYIIDYEAPLNFRNLVNLPLKLIIPFSISDLFKTLGVGVLFAFFIDYKKNKYIFLKIFFFFIVMVILMQNLQVRWFLPIIFLISIFYNQIKNKKIIFNTLLYIQYSFVIIIMIFVSIISISTNINKNLKDMYLGKSIKGFSLYKTIKSQYPENKIITDFQFWYYMEDPYTIYNINSKSIFFNQKNLTNNKKHILLLNAPNINLKKLMKIIGKKESDYINKKFNYNSATGRNIFNSKKFINEIYISK